MSAAGLSGRVAEGDASWLGRSFVRPAARARVLDSPSVPDRWPKVILINGPSSAGKSTLARDLQTAVTHPYLVTGFDDFIFMSAPRYYLGADTGSQSTVDEFTGQGVQMRRTSGVDEPPRVVADFGPVFRRILDAMAPAVRTLVNCGNDVIFDHVLHDQAHYESLRVAFAGLDVLRVGVVCPLEVLEERERSRGRSATTSNARDGWEPLR
ncbi:MAG: AAA family ATPase [Candidatus Nanopelagicales bacterium]